MAKVYSYIRFSTPEQAMGDSERRQLDAAKAWVDRNGHTLDESLMDKGVSAHRGKNAAEGNLGTLLKRIEHGDIEKGSILLIENIDRLSRQQPSKTFKLLESIIRQGVVVQTLSPEHRYDKNPLDDPAAVYPLLGYMQRAYEESRIKSKRQSEAWIRKREKGKKGNLITQSCPKWLEPTDVELDEKGRVVGGKFKVRKNAAKTIKEIFDLTLKGWSGYRIERYLNEKAAWIPEKQRKRETGGWRVSYIRKILKSRSVIGEYIPRKVETAIIETKDGKKEIIRKVPIENEVWKDYYPQIVDRENWHAVQKRLDDLKTKSTQTGGRRGRFDNVLRHLCKCHDCGSPLHFFDKYRLNGAGQYLICDSKRRLLGCEAPRIRFRELRDVILTHLTQLKPEQVLPNPDEAAKKSQSLRDGLEGLANELSENANEQTNLVNRIKKTPDEKIGDMLEAELTKTITREQELKDRQKVLRDALREAEHKTATFEQWQANLNTLIKQIDGDDSDLRMSLNSHLQQFVHRIEISCDDDTGKLVTVVIFEKVSVLPPGEQWKEWKHPTVVADPKVVKHAGREYTLHFISAKEFGPNGLG